MLMSVSPDKEWVVIDYQHGFTQGGALYLETQRGAPVLLDDIAIDMESTLPFFSTGGGQ